MNGTAAYALGVGKQEMRIMLGMVANVNVAERPVRSNMSGTTANAVGVGRQGMRGIHGTNGLIIFVQIVECLNLLMRS